MRLSMRAKAGLGGVMPGSRALAGLIGLALLAMTGAAASELAECPQSGVTWHTVTEVRSGDTVILADGREVRLSAVTAPKARAARDGRPARDALANAARHALSRAIGHDRGAGRIGLGSDQQRTDRFNRLIAHGFADPARPGEPPTWLQGALIDQGLAVVDSYADQRGCLCALITREAAARAANRGLWRTRLYRALPADDVTSLTRASQSFQRVEGRVAAQAQVRGRVFVNFGSDWRTDFTLVISADVVQRLKAEARDGAELVGRRVAVRGWLSLWNGPVMDITHPEQIMLLDGGERAWGCPSPP